MRGTSANATNASKLNAFPSECTPGRESREVAGLKLWDSCVWHWGLTRGGILDWHNSPRVYSLRGSSALRQCTVAVEGGESGALCDTVVVHCVALEHCMVAAIHSSTGALHCRTAAPARRGAVRVSECLVPRHHVRMPLAGVVHRPGEPLVAGEPGVAGCSKVGD